MKSLVIGVLVLAVFAVGAYFGFSKEGALVKTVQARDVTWKNLLPEGFSAEKLNREYQVAVRDLDDSDPEVMEIYQEFVFKINNAPLNQALNNTDINLTGFISPLNYDAQKIKEFLLVPYFGACIHVPAPPLNQTVYVKLQDGQEIDAETAYVPVTVSGKIVIQKASTEIGDAGYSILQARSTPFEGEDIP